MMTSFFVHCSLYNVPRNGLELYITVVVELVPLVSPNRKDQAFRSLTRENIYCSIVIVQLCEVKWTLEYDHRHTPPTHRHRPGCWGGGGSSCVWRLPWRAGSADPFLGRPRTRTRTLARHSSRNTRPFQGYDNGTWDCKQMLNVPVKAWIEDYRFRITKVSTGHTFYLQWVNTCQNSFPTIGPDQWCLPALMGYFTGLH